LSKRYSLRLPGCRFPCRVHPGPIVLNPYLGYESRTIGRAARGTETASRLLSISPGEPPDPPVRVGHPATATREPRQARKGAAAAVTPGAGERLARATCAASTTLPH